MTVPSIFASDFRKLEVPDVADVQTALDKIVEELLALDDPWTLVSGTEYQSPVSASSADQRFMRVALSRISATRLGFHVKDQGGFTVFDGAIDISGTATVRIFAGPHHLVVEADSAGTKESCWGAIIDPSPYPLYSLGNYVAANAHRNAAGTVVGAGLADVAEMRDSESASVGRIAVFYNNSNDIPQTGGGAIPKLPAEIRTEPSTNVHRSAGYLPQMLVFPGNASPGSTIDVKLDASVTGKFFVLGKSSPTTQPQGRLAVRST